MADVMTFEEHRGPIAGQVVAWCGDGNNVAPSLDPGRGALRLRAAPGQPRGAAPAAGGGRLGRATRAAEIVLTDDPAEAVAGADCVVTDTWVSMGRPERRAGTTCWRPTG